MNSIRISGVRICLFVGLFDLLIFKAIIDMNLHLSLQDSLFQTQDTLKVLISLDVFNKANLLMAAITSFLIFKPKAVVEWVFLTDEQQPSLTDLLFSESLTILNFVSRSVGQCSLSLPVLIADIGHLRDMTIKHRRK